MLTLYGIANCDTVKKARVWLTSQGMEYEFHDYKKKGITREKLHNWLTQVPWEKLLNRSGTTWRKLPDDQKIAVTDADSAADLLSEYTSAIKRPLIENEAGRVLILGFSEADYTSLFTS